MKKQWGTLPVEAMYVAAIAFMIWDERMRPCIGSIPHNFLRRLFASILSDKNPTEHRRECI